jgi:hypothetical protein
VRAEVDHLVAEAREMLGEQLLQFETSVVRSHGYVHRASLLAKVAGLENS